MKFTKQLLSFAIVASLFSCSSDDDNRTINPGGTTATGITGTQLLGDITEDATLLASVQYTLAGSVTVKDGVTLTIQPGTTIQARSGRTDVFLAVERGGRLVAQGTATNPITFTSDAAAPRAGDWGGIVIAGRARSNAGENVQSEVAGLLYGGNDDFDSSGILSYVIAEYTGAKINGDSEFNGISLFGVGSGTILNNIVISNGSDDGIEFFGGTVNATNIYCGNIGDDMFDWTEGYSGTITNAFGVRNNGFTVASDDPRGIEGDSNGSDATALPISTPTLNNVTILNLDPSTPLTAGAEIRRGTVATINNVLFAAYGGASFANRIDTVDGRGDGVLTLTNASAQGNVGMDKADSTINGTVEVVTDVVTVPADNTVEITAGIGADLSAFDWANRTFSVVAQ